MPEMFTRAADVRAVMPEYRETVIAVEQPTPVVNPARIATRPALVTADQVQRRRYTMSLKAVLKRAFGWTLKFTVVTAIFALLSVATHHDRFATQMAPAMRWVFNAPVVGDYWTNFDSAMDAQVFRYAPQTTLAGIYEGDVGKWKATFTLNNGSDWELERGGLLTLTAKDKILQIPVAITTDAKANVMFVNENATDIAVRFSGRCARSDQGNRSIAGTIVVEGVSHPVNFARNRFYGIIRRPNNG